MVFANDNRWFHRGTYGRPGYLCLGMYILEVLSGPYDGKTWPFEREITIGRDGAVAGACITLDRYISRRHAVVRAEGERLVLADLESRNGTRLAGDARVTTDTALEPGERFIIGRTLLRVRAAE